MSSFEGKVAVITGAGGGLGVAQTDRFLRAGATVVATDLVFSTDDTGGPEHEGQLHHREQDVTSQASWNELVGWTVDTFGHLDVLVNNAGYFRAGSLEESSVDQMDKHYRVNQLGVFLGMATVTPQMKIQRGGSIVNISSLTGMRGVPGQFAYAASKWAVRGMTKCAALDLAAYGIRVNSIHPGLIDTPILRGLDGAQLEAAIAEIPSRAMGRPLDVAEAVAFLASDAALYINGVELPVAGGAGI